MGISDWPARRFILLLIFLAALLPRVLALDAYVAPDEGKWIYRSAHFLLALQRLEFAKATSVAATPEVEVLAPAVPTMAAGAVGLLARYWFEGSPGRLEEYLEAIPAKTERLPLDVYPWARLPTVLLTSLAIPVFYGLFLRLVRPGAALLAALWLALDPFFISLSRVIHHDALVVTFMLLSLLALLVYGRPDGPAARRWLVLSGVAAGLALLTKPLSFYLVLFAGLFLLLTARQPGGRFNWRRAGLDLVTWAGLAGLTFVVAWPAMWVAPLETLLAMAGRSASAMEDGNNYALLPAAGTPLPELGLLFYPVNWLFKATLPGLAGLVALGLALVRGRLAGKSRWTAGLLAVFVLIFWLGLLPADTRDVRYFLAPALVLYILAAVGLAALVGPGRRLAWLGGLLVVVQAGLAAAYYPYYVDYWNPVAGGPWLAPRLVKIGSGEGLDRMARYLNAKPNAANLTVATSFWESFVPFFAGHYTKAHYDDEADYILIYLRQVQNRNPFPEYWTYFSARTPEHTVSLHGLEYAWLYPGPQLRVAREADFGDGLAVRGYRLDQPSARPGRPTHLTLVWAGVPPAQAGRPVVVQLRDEGGRAWVEGAGPLLSPEGPSTVEGHYELALPADIPPGKYELWVSLADGSAPPSRRVGKVPVTP